ncbi:GH92 family glycosyl hydrolase [Mangrovibacterium diazotrophicum]|uniref:Putative alpha-1,2-mannosidase n=1 Tax=Mangrovibacterium diazotrophicum TaxID=1261403 RepID=A0A419VX61_9BACT|nr:GH92 family glycosyl hydrolase [Mangrovibacterium diazotrophicum]RKD87821.1 putative alpha-1,2-mannosidase [Mangrovibacterium diazotrophicum]
MGRKIGLMAAMLVCSLVLKLNAQTFDPVSYVSTLVGTSSKYALSTGNTYPATAMPWGMNFWSPQTGKNGDGWMYRYTDDKIRGFKQTHQPSPWMNDYGQFSIMPITGEPIFNEEKRASWFSHKAEVAKPYYYSAYLADFDITTEIAPTERAAMFRFTFPDSKNSYIVTDAFDRGSAIKIIPEENKIVGYTTRNSGGVPDNFKNYFVIVFDKPFTYFATVNDSIITEGTKVFEGGHAGAIIGFETSKGEQVNARVASSFISEEQALINLKELGNDDFDTIKAKGKARWNEVLGKIKVDDDNIDNLRTFYSCMYRSVLFPRNLSEIDAKGNVVHYSPYNGKVLPGYMFTDTGFWDTFRSLFPFLNLVFPAENEKMQEGLVNAYKESGFLPEWASPGHRNIMVGNNSASVVADAYLKGLRGYDIETLWEALKHDANNVHPTVGASGRTGYKEYNQYGYIPNDIGIRQNVARTLEYAYDDWTIYRLGKALNKPESEIRIYAKRAMNYKNLFNPKNKLMAGRAADGSFADSFEPTDWSRDFTEGNSWHYSWSVFQDPQGLIDLMGGEKEFVTMLDSVFIIPGSAGMKSRGMIHEMREMQVMDMGQYAHGNQPIQHMVYLYDYAGTPWKAQYWAREIMDKLYSAAPDGYCGDEDNGQTSAWYVFSALGFYPVCPGSNQYILGAPLFKSVKIELENGNEITIDAPNNAKETRYINQMTMNGEKYCKNYLTHEDLMKGAQISFEMSSTPNPKRGTSKKDFPYSFSNEK